MRLASTVMLATMCGGCVFEVWAGAGAARQNGETAAAWSFGASSGFYLDPIKLRTRVGFSKYVDKTYLGGNGNVAETRASGWSSARVDVLVQDVEKHGATHPKLLSAVFSWADRARQVERVDMMTRAQAGDLPWKAFVGYTVDGVHQPGQFLTDSLSYSIGPYYSRWDGGASGRVDAVGAELRLTLAVGPLGMVEVAAGMSEGFKVNPSGGGGSSTSSNHGTPAAPKKTCTTTQDCYPDSTTGKDVCVSRTFCD